MSNSWAWCLDDNLLVHLPSGACFARGTTNKEYAWKLLPSLGLSLWGPDAQYGLVLRENLEKQNWIAVWSIPGPRNKTVIDNLEHDEMFSALSEALLAMGLWTGGSHICWRDTNKNWLIDYTEGNYINPVKFSFCYESNKPSMSGSFELGFNLRIYEYFKYGTFVWQEIRILSIDTATKYQHFIVDPKSNKLSKEIMDLKSQDLISLLDVLLR